MIKSSISLFCLTILTGCTTFYAHHNNISNQIDDLVESKQFDKALEMVDSISPDHSDYQDLSSQALILEKQREDYIQEVLIEAKQFESIQDWVKAEQRITDARKTLPTSQELITQQKYYQDKRMQRVAMDNAAILITKAHYYIDSRPYQESRLYNSGSSFLEIKKFNRFEKEANDISSQLYVIGQQYWRAHQVTQAKEALTLSVQTSDNKLSQALLEEILDLERKLREQERANKRKKASDQAPEMEKSFAEHLEFGDFSGAQRILAEMETLGLSSASQERANLEKRKAEAAAELIESGNNLYNSGLIQKAVLRWEQALELDPEDTNLKQQLERAKRFLDNMERWKNKN